MAGSVDAGRATPDFGPAAPPEQQVASGDNTLVSRQQHQFTNAATSTRDIPIRMGAGGVAVVGPGLPVPDGSYVEIAPIGGNVSDNCFVSTAGTDAATSGRGPASQYKRTTLPRRIRVRNLNDIAVWSDTAGDGVIVSIQIDR